MRLTLTSLAAPAMALMLVSAPWARAETAVTFLDPSATLDPAHEVANSDALARVRHALLRYATRTDLAIVLVGHRGPGCAEPACPGVRLLQRRAEAVAMAVAAGWPAQGGPFPFDRLSWLAEARTETNGRQQDVLRIALAPAPSQSAGGNPACPVAVTLQDPMLPLPLAEKSLPGLALRPGESVPFPDGGELSVEATGEAAAGAGWQVTLTDAEGMSQSWILTGAPNGAFPVIDPEAPPPLPINITITPPGTDGGPVAGRQASQGRALIDDLLPWQEPIAEPAQEAGAEAGNGVRACRFRLVGKMPVR